MNIRKLLDWRKLLIYSHRWMGIGFGLLFVSWFISGVVIMYKGMPQLPLSERLAHETPLDLSTVRLSPIEAARMHEIRPARLEVDMHNGRPVYRFQGASIYADDGEKVHIRRAKADDAVEIVRKWAPEHAANVRYVLRLEDSDQWTLQSATRQFMPLHKISLGDEADTYYYVSERNGEIVMKTDRESRFWGFWSAVLHWVYFPPLRRQTALWNHFIVWGSFAGAVMCLSGLVIGVWRLSPGARFRQKHNPSHSPYSGWMRWHHYSGLLFGLVSFTWIFSGAMSVNPFGWSPGTGPTREQRDALTGGPLSVDGVSLENLRAAYDVIRGYFVPNELSVAQFRGERLLTASRPGSARDSMIVSLDAPERGPITQFDHATMHAIARDAMPGVAIEEEVWLSEYDNYYRSRDNTRPLPVLRIKYADPQQTWLYLDPHRGTIAMKQERRTRWNRWLYTGLHSLDLPFLYERRPLWDIVVILLSIGGTLLSITTIWPMLRRLYRHARRLGAFAIRKPAPRKTQVTVGDSL
jgi:hypothetical protein